MHRFDEFHTIQWMVATFSEWVQSLRPNPNFDLWQLEPIVIDHGGSGPWTSGWFERQRWWGSTCAGNSEIKGQSESKGQIIPSDSKETNFRCHVPRHPHVSGPHRQHPRRKMQFRWCCFLSRPLAKLDRTCQHACSQGHHQEHQEHQDQQHHQSAQPRQQQSEVIKDQQSHQDHLPGGHSSHHLPSNNNSRHHHHLPNNHSRQQGHLPNNHSSHHLPNNNGSHQGRNQTKESERKPDSHSL